MSVSLETLVCCFIDYVSLLVKYEESSDLAYKL